ncbi:hypothetical protein L6164_025281 [Bauhinia variegata]|uniref:Uncharacterized protein n=1 Tax=Bauhinia variegata TaxID=167791 RepID=A0ACB9M064_BAUVA|nr:hypothetical protein L6164_025281 [Bauhinia variegata]
MATIRSPTVTLTIFAVLCALFTASYGSRGRFVGGRTEIKDVKTNEEVQELGRFSVEEYNRSLRLWRNHVDGRELKFVEVVAAERQVVAGIKYYLKVLAIENENNRVFESVVRVQPWVHSKRLLNFAPSISFNN